MAVKHGCLPGKTGNGGGQIYALVLGNKSLHWHASCWGKFVVVQRRWRNTTLKLTLPRLQQQFCVGDTTTCIPSLLHQRLCDKAVSIGWNMLSNWAKKPPQMRVQTLTRIRASLFKFLLFSKTSLFFVTLQNVYGNTPRVTVMSCSLQVAMATWSSHFCN